MQVKCNTKENFFTARNNIENLTKGWYNVFYLRIANMEIFINKYETNIIYENKYDYFEKFKTTKKIWNLAYEIDVNGKKDAEILLKDEIISESILTLNIK